MLTQIIIGSALSVTIILVHIILIECAIRLLSRIEGFIRKTPPFKSMIFGTFVLSIWLLMAFSIAIWVWAFALYGLGVFDAMEPSLYFCMAAFTTLGLGDLVLPEAWRLLSGFIAANGLIIFGLNTAFLVAALTGMRPVATEDTRL